MQQGAPPPSQVLEYAARSRRLRLPAIHWPSFFVSAVLLAGLNWLPGFRTSVPPGVADGLEYLLGWPWVFKSFGGMGGSYVYDWFALALDALVLLAISFGVGFAACCITRQCSGPEPRV